MKLIQSFLTQNDCYKLNKPIVVKGLMLHSVGCSQPSASVFLKQWNKSGVAKAVHGFIEPNGNVYQTLPFNIKGWHGASGVKGSVNATHLGFEMTEPSTIKYSGGGQWTDTNPLETKKFVLATYSVAVELFAYLCKEFKLDPLADGVIISHHEGFLRGIASGHGDTEHIWNKMGLTMGQFRKDVKAAMEVKEDNVIDTGEEAIQYLVSKGKMTNPQNWLNNLTQIKDINFVQKNLKYIFIKWAEEVKETLK